MLIWQNLDGSCIKRVVETLVEKNRSLYNVDVWKNGRQPYRCLNGIHVSLHNPKLVIGLVDYLRAWSSIRARYQRMHSKGNSRGDYVE